MGLGDRKRLVELKARCQDLGAARNWTEVNSEFIGEFHQVDTYFAVQRGRLKLRVVDRREDGTLIFYQRENTPMAKRSQVHLIPVGKATAMEELFNEALGVRAVVEKERRIYRWGRVQIHLDRVKGLGDFIEFERVVESSADEAAGREEFSTLERALSMRPSDRIAGSYIDLLESS